MTESYVDVAQYNRTAWDREVALGSRWSIPVTPAQIAAARAGTWDVILTPTRPVPRPWFGALEGASVLCLASAGGQQAPILAAAGATVTVLDNSPAQLKVDRLVAARDGLTIRLELGLMQDLSRFADGAFDLVFHPVSNCFVPDVRPVWREAHRVLRPGGTLLAGFANPVLYLFDPDAETDLTVRHTIPYADQDQRSAQALAGMVEALEPVEFGHSLDDQIGGQLDAGFTLAGFYEDGYPGHRLDRHLKLFIATSAIKA